MYIYICLSGCRYWRRSLQIRSLYHPNPEPEPKHQNPTITMSGLLNKAKEAMGKSSGGSADAATGGAGGTQSGIEKGISGAGHTRKLHSHSLSLSLHLSYSPI